MQDVEPARPDQPGQGPDHAGRGPPPGIGRGDELQPELGDPAGQRAGPAEDDHLVAEVADAGGQLDGVQLAAADLQDVRVDQDPHGAAPASRSARNPAGSGAPPWSRAGAPNHSRPAGTSRVTTAAIPTIAQAPTVRPCRIVTELPT